VADNSAQTDVVGLFLARAASKPDAVAVQTGSVRHTYGALEMRTRQFAACFAANPAPRVLIALPRGLDAYAAMLGAALAGGFYAPVNEASPVEKQRQITNQLDPDFIVAPAAVAQQLASAARGPVCIDPATLLSDAAFTGPGRRHRIAYIIFTSGSTGNPKGVVISHPALAHYIHWIKASGSIRPGDRVSQFNNLAFDVSVFDIYGALCLGATLVPIASRGDRMFPARAIGREKLTTWTSVPSVLNLMMTAEDVTWENLNTVRLFTFAGEPLLRQHLEAIFAVCPGAVIQNAYGPTETTVTVTSLMLTRDDYVDACRGAAVSIGPAIPGMNLHLAGGATEDDGELVIVGPQVADGYWQNPARTAQSFRDYEASGGKVRAYFTGDLAERHGEHVFFKERIDFQVKIRGNRVELDEVAAAIHACGWATICVFKWNEVLVALIECPDTASFDAEALRTGMEAHIESFAIPEEIHAVSQLPRNENDKIDRKLAALLFESLPRG
jgi:D-alanine--poly(phosphoribitol) ligase subunit 1